jgi:probable F420-dependent oxidoreductase
LVVYSEVVTSIGLALPQLGPHLSRGLIRDFCRTAEEYGFGSLWAQDHLFVPVSPRSGYSGREGLEIPAQYRSNLGIFELLAAAASWTERALIGTSIVVGGYHRPLELAQSLATLDVLSGGRLVVGVGTGWSQDEHEQMNVEFATRGRRLDDLIHALRACWEPDPVSYEGEFFSIPPSYVAPKPLQERVPIIGAANSGRALRRVAELCDGWHPVLSMDRVQELRPSLEELRPAAEAPLPVWLRVFVQFPGGPAWGIERLTSEVRRAAEAGFPHVVVDASFSDELNGPGDWLRMVERLAPLVAIGS